MMEGQFRSLIDIFKTGKEQYPEKTAIIMGEDTRTYGQIFDNAKRIAGFVLEKEIILISWLRRAVRLLPSEENL